MEKITWTTFFFPVLYTLKGFKYVHKYMYVNFQWSICVSSSTHPFENKNDFQSDIKEGKFLFACLATEELQRICRCRMHATHHFSESNLRPVGLTCTICLISLGLIRLKHSLQVTYEAILRVSNLYSHSNNSYFVPVIFITINASLRSIANSQNWMFLSFGLVINWTN